MGIGRSRGTGLDLISPEIQSKKHNAESLGSPRFFVCLRQTVLLRLARVILSAAPSEIPSRDARRRFAVRFGLAPSLRMTRGGAVELRSSARQSRAGSRANRLRLIFVFRGRMQSCFATLNCKFAYANIAPPLPHEILFADGLRKFDCFFGSTKALPYRVKYCVADCCGMPQGGYCKPSARSVVMIFYS